MWISIFLNILFSIIIIYLGHHLWEYLRDKYTTKKTVDLVNSQTQKYKKMMEEIQNSESNKKESKNYDNNLNKEEVNMEKELINFINSI